MKGYIDHLERLGFLMSQELAKDMILNSLPGSYDNFIMDYNMNNMKESISELHGMLKTAKLSLREAQFCFVRSKREGDLTDSRKLNGHIYDITTKRFKSNDLNPTNPWSCGIVSQLTPPGTPQWNGVSEQRNRTLLDMVRSMMSQTDLPPSFWGHALEIAAFTLNRVLSKAVEKTPYEIWTGKKPSLSFLKIWGCEVYVKQQASDKLSSRSSKCLYVGYPKETKGYYVYNPTDHKMFVIQNGVLLEKEFISKRTSGSKVNLEEVQESQDDIEPQMENGEDSQQVVEPTHVTQDPRRSDRTQLQPRDMDFDSWKP
ncbi:hypothetical protein K1719_027493 [Acacia pycnantha]|nr:hypothetical protein K1719_027493 [Acacia pycnantha]